MLLRSPAFTLLALVTLALGIGANTTIFSVVNAVLLRPLPYQDPDRIVQIVDTREMRGTVELASSFPKFTFIHDQAGTFDSAAAFSNANFHLSAGASNDQGPIQVNGIRTSSGFFRVLGVAPLLGRAFLAEEDRAGGGYVAVISYDLWVNRFAADRNLIGRSVGVDGDSTIVIGVMPPEFDFPADTKIWVPRTFESSRLTRQQIEHGAGYLSVIARLSPHSTLRQAQAELETLNQQYNATHEGFTDDDRGIRVSPLREQLVRNVRPTLLVLLGAVGFVLLIASGNVANLLLARAVSRGKEVAVRSALGASRGRLLIQFLTESVLLSLLGAGLGLLLSLWSIQLVTKLGPGIIPRADEIHINGPVLAFTVIVSVLTGIIFGLGPAMYSLRVDLNEALKATARGLGGSLGGGRLRGLMVAGEVALAVILLTGAGLLMRSFTHLLNVDPGFRPQQLLTMSIGLPPARYPRPLEQSGFYDQLLLRVGALPGVRNTAVISVLPMGGGGVAYFFNIEGRPKLEPAKAPFAMLGIISPAYFETMGIPLLKGRPFADADSAETPKVAIINDTMARRFWPGEDPLGRRLTYSREQITVEVIGVVGDVKFNGLGAASAGEEMYVPYRQRPSLAMWRVTRGAANPVNLASAIRHEVLAMDPDQPVSNVRTMDEVISDSVTQPRLRTVLMGSFAALSR